jgi:predicted MPP superfamily phosphohydrolase
MAARNSRRVRIDKVVLKLKKSSRRRFLAALGAAFVCAPFAGAADAKYIEPTWLKIRRVRIGNGKPAHRFVHFSDLHHKGDRKYLQTVVNVVNSLAPDFVCFTGDIVEEQKFLTEALELMSQIKSPMFGVPGNHDYWSRISFEPVFKSFGATGGAWLLDEAHATADGQINIIGVSCSHANQALLPLNPSVKNILLMHYPVWAKKVGGQKFDLMLAGHSHGGQVRVPFYGALVLPYGVDEYDLGLFQTKSGPLYVNPGIGYIGDNDFRFNCRPEITVIEI